MKKTFFYFVILIFSIHHSILIADAYKSLNIDFLKSKNSSKKVTSQPKDNSKKKSFINAIKGYNKIEGLFNIYK